MAPTIRLREGVNTRLQTMFDCTTDGAVADVLGIDASQFSRVSTWSSSPGPNFMARLLIATDGKATFDDLFEIVEEKDAASRTLRRAS